MTLLPLGPNVLAMHAEAILNMEPVGTLLGDLQGQTSNQNMMLHKIEVGSHY